MDWVHILVTPAASALIGAVVAALVGRAKSAASESRVEDEAMREGMLALLRSQLTEVHTVHVVRGAPLGLYERDNVARVYQAYRDLGGNDIGEHQFAEISALPINDQA